MNNAVIPIKLEFVSENELEKDDINIRSVLVEIQHGLEMFHKNGDKTAIDLASIPLTAFERNRLFELLGQGEVSIHLSSLGESEIHETNFSGVWVIKHRDEQEQISSMLIEICAVPDIVLSQSNENERLLIDNL